MAPFCICINERGPLVVLGWRLYFTPMIIYYNWSYFLLTDTMGIGARCAAHSGVVLLGAPNALNLEPWFSTFQSRSSCRPTPTHLTHHAIHESKTKSTFLYAKGHSAQPEMFWRTHHTKPVSKSMRVMSFCLWGV